MSSGTGIYFDGVTSARHEVVVELAPTGLKISSRDGKPWGEWPYHEIEELDAPDNILRLGRRGSATLERLEIRDPAFAGEIDARAIHVDRTGSLAATPAHAGDRSGPWGYCIPSMVAWFGVPAIAARLTPLLPVSVERKLGDAVDIQVRGISIRARRHRFRMRHGRCGNSGTQRARQTDAAARSRRGPSDTPANERCAP